MKTIKDLMTADPRVLPVSATVKEAADVMRDDDIGDVVVVTKAGKLFGIITDRDIAVRVIADGKDPEKVTLEEVASKDVTTLSPDATVKLAVKTMRDQAIRRIPIVQDGKPVGIVSLGDLAIERDPESVLADISSAPASSVAAPSANGSHKSGMSAALPAAAVGAGIALTYDYMRNRGKKRSVKISAKRLRRAGKKLRKSGDKAGSDAAHQASLYATAAAKEIRSRSKKMRKSAESGARDLGKQAEGMAHKVGKQAERKAKDISKKAERKAREVGKKADRKTTAAGKRAERKVNDLKEMAEAGRR